MGESEWEKENEREGRAGGEGEREREREREREKEEKERERKRGDHRVSNGDVVAVVWLLCGCCVAVVQLWWLGCPYMAALVGWQGVGRQSGAGTGDITTAHHASVVR